VIIAIKKYNVWLIAVVIILLTCLVWFFIAKSNMRKTPLRGVYVIHSEATCKRGGTFG
jgi:hypothetical protein